MEIETDDAEHQLAVRGFVALWRGLRPHLTELDADPAVVDAMQRRGLIVVDPDGHLAGIHGLATRPTAHHIAHAGGIAYTWCAFDAVGIPAALGLNAQAHTTCPTCDRQLQVTFDAGERTAEPDLRLWLPTTQCQNILDDFCAHADLYCDEQHLSTNQTGSIGTVVTVEQAAALGRSTWADAATALDSI